jgi:flagellar basal-body rod protein FlgF/flagellar basal-body rod protein FlgG
MPYGLYLSAEGAHAQTMRLEVLANNLANVDTVGFKRQLAVFQARYAEAIRQGLDEPGSGTVNDVGGGIVVRQTKTDFSPGPMKRTEALTDMALPGEGFFVVRKGEQELLTRAGNFRLTERGDLVTQQGHAVLSEGGTPIVIDPRSGPFEVTTSGAIRQPGAVQNLAIVRPASLGDLVRMGESLFRPLAQPEPVPAAERRVAAGYVETSGVQPAREMVRLIETSRAIESNLSMMQAQDQMLSGLITRVMRS